MFIFPVYSIVFRWFSGKGWDISWHLQMQHNQAKFSDIHFLHNRHYHITTNTVTTTAITTTTITTTTTDESFIFTSSTYMFEGSLARKLCFHIVHFQLQQVIQGNIWALPCLALAAHLGRTDRDCVIFFYRFVIVRVIVWDTWLYQKSCKTMILGNPSFENS